jgi:alpha-ketoglutarate-dependent taurine dioxygenase
MPQEAADGAVIELGAIRGFFGVLILSTTQILHPVVRASTKGRASSITFRHSPRTSRYLQMRTQFFYTHRWRVKSIVLWDNCPTTPGGNSSLATRWEA